MPAVVTALCVQKNNRERISLFCDDRFLIGIHQSTLLHYGINKNSEITEQLFRELQKAENEKEIENYLLNLLSRRMHARSELKVKAQRKGYPAGTIENLLHRFENEGWVDDAEFARSFAREKFDLHRWGPVKIRSKLRSLGISQADIEHALKEIKSSDEDVQVLEQLIIKRSAYFHREPDLQKRKRKIADYLLHKGFSSDTIFKHLERLITLTEE